MTDPGEAGGWCVGGAVSSCRSAAKIPNVNHGPGRGWPSILWPRGEPLPDLERMRKYTIPMASSLTA